MWLDGDQTAARVDWVWDRIGKIVELGAYIYFVICLWMASLVPYARADGRGKRPDIPIIILQTILCNHYALDTASRVTFLFCFFLR